jgi:Fur family transcriptional regulator, ferric uptake regulator
VLQEFLAEGSRVHLTAAQIAERLEAHGTGMDPTTVYRTLSAFTGAGLLHPLFRLDHAVAYGLSDPAHLHAICVGCGRVDTRPPTGADALLTELEAATGHAPDGSGLAVYGLCRDCAEQD